LLYESPEKISSGNNILINYNNYNGNCGLYLNYKVIVKSDIKEEINFENISSIASTVGKKNVIGAGNVYIGNTISGSKLVNKNVDVTYDSYTGNEDGTDDSNYFSAGGVESNTTRTGNYYDGPLLFWDQFEFDTRATSDVLHNLAGKIANDDYDMIQILSYCPVNSVTPVLPDGRANHLCENEYIDSMKIFRNWDDRKYSWDKNFKFDNVYVSEDFEIIYFDYFQFDGKYIGGGYI